MVSRPLIKHYAFYTQGGKQEWKNVFHYLTSVMDADSDLDPLFHFDADPDPTFYLDAIRVLILIKSIRICEST
jgi:hypothetical protein